jgi:predicted Zn-dependent protease
MSCEAVGSAKEAAKLDPSNQKYVVLAQQVTRACAVIQSAEADYTKAKQLFDQGDYCEGKGAIDEAIKKAPTNRTYLELQESLRKGCTIP